MSVLGLPAIVLLVLFALSSVKILKEYEHRHCKYNTHRVR